jgi:hypothetical protein
MFGSSAKLSVSQFYNIDCGDEYNGRRQKIKLRGCKPRIAIVVLLSIFLFFEKRYYFASRIL